MSTNDAGFIRGLSVQIKDLATKRTIKKLLDQNQEESAGTKNVFHELRPTDKTTGLYNVL